MADANKVKDDSTGKWHGICAALGIKVGDGKHTACPMCGGKDRFRFDDKEGKGTWFCNGCKAGDGFALVMGVLKCSFPEALEAVGKVVGTAEKRNIPKESKITTEKMREIFNTSRPATEKNPVGAYLKNRGLSVVPATLRYQAKCWCSERKKECPAMLAVFTRPDGFGATMHRTYITADGKKAAIESVKKLLPTVRDPKGGAIRLFPLDGEILAIAEGIETAIAVYEDTRLPCWAAYSTTMLEQFEPPPKAKHIAIFADNDRNFAGQAAAYTLAHRLALKGLAVEVHLPHRAGEDWLDVHNRQKKIK